MPAVVFGGCGPTFSRFWVCSWCCLVGFFIVFLCVNKFGFFRGGFSWWWCSGWFVVWITSAGVCGEVLGCFCVLGVVVGGCRLGEGMAFCGVVGAVLGVVWLQYIVERLIPL